MNFYYDSPGQAAFLGKKRERETFFMRKKIPDLKWAQGRKESREGLT